MPDYISKFVITQQEIQSRAPQRPHNVAMSTPTAIMASRLTIYPDDPRNVARYKSRKQAKQAASLKRQAIIMKRKNGAKEHHYAM